MPSAGAQGWVQGTGRSRTEGEGRIADAGKQTPVAAVSMLTGHKNGGRRARRKSEKAADMAGAEGPSCIWAEEMQDSTTLVEAPAASSGAEGGSMAPGPYAAAGGSGAKNEGKPGGPTEAGEGLTRVRQERRVADDHFEAAEIRAAGGSDCRRMAGPERQGRLTDGGDAHARQPMAQTSTPSP